MKLKIIILTGLFMLSLASEAQRRKPVAKKPAVEEPVEDPRIAQMLASTQQIMFIDSLVVEQADFMSHIPLSPYMGKLTQTEGLGTFTNEMGDHRLITVKTSDSTSVIMATDFIANRWTEAQPVGGISRESSINPFLMPDGITLYFAQKGANSIGGYDIFVTRYDSEKGVFLRPENIGMPFASKADDLFYAIDEFNQLGYFVTNRRQPAGKVCIYTFIPQESRRIYQTEAYSDQQLRSLAAINSIADTWQNKEDYQKALARLSTDQTVNYHAMSSVQNAQANTEIDKLRHEAGILDKTLALMRKQYATATEGQRVTLRIKILNAEQQLEDMQLDIRNREKQIPYEQ
jgi:hypothetical protein